MKNRENVDEVYKPLNTKNLFFVIMLVATIISLVYISFYDGVDDFIVNEMVGETSVRFQDAGQATIEWKATYHTDPPSSWEKIVHLFNPKEKSDEDETYPKNLDFYLNFGNEKEVDVKQGDIKQRVENVIRLKSSIYVTTKDFFTNPNIDDICIELLSGEIVTFEITNIMFPKYFLDALKKQHKLAKQVEQDSIAVVEAEQNLMAKREIARQIMIQDSIEKEMIIQHVEQDMKNAKQAVEKAIEDKEIYYNSMRIEIRTEILDSLNKLK